MKDIMKMITKIQNAQALYVLMSVRTRLPYVVCDDETCDDEVFVYFEEKEIVNRASELLKKGVPTQPIKIEQKNGLAFFSSLYAMGVNAVRFDQGCVSETMLPLDKIVRRPDADKLPEGQQRFENPAFHLTAMYFLQETRTGEPVELTEDLAELQEEMMIHFWEGKILLATQEDQKSILLMKNKEGRTFQPIFTDVNEFKKFATINKQPKLNMVVINAKDLPKVMAKDAERVVVNPFGLNLQLDIAREEVEA